MKLFFTLLLLSLWSLQLPAQSDSLRDYRWQIGYSSNPQNTDFGGTDFNFHETPVELSYIYREMNFDQTNASICDRTGELLFYTNGISIANRFGDSITNGNGLNPGYYADESQQFGYKVVQGAFVLPAPEDESLYYLIHESYDYNEIGETHTSFHLYFTVVDMSAPEGLVLAKNNLLLQDTFDVGKTTAVRHANGRDWWILKARFGSNEFHTFLLSPKGIELIQTQSIGLPIEESGGLSQAVFSPDGTKYARNDGNYIPGPQYLKLYDFDRCSGLLSNFQEVIIPDTSYGSGVAFSPNSRYLYTTVTSKLFQYDTEAVDFAGSQQLIAEWNGTVAPHPFAANFFMMQLAPDNKIYINCKNGVYAMHIIHSPDQPGAACNFEDIGLSLPTYNNSSLPHFPNYRLGALPGSPCDTLNLISPTQEIAKPPLHLAISPNPVDRNGLLHVEVPNGNISGQLRLYNTTGQPVETQFIASPPQGVKTPSVIELTMPDQPGMYFLEWLGADGQRVVRKVVVR